MVFRIAVVVSLCMVTAQSWPYAGPGCGQTGAPASVEFVKPKASVPMETWGPRPAVEVTINGQGPFRLLIDTGTNVAAILNADVAEELGLSPTESTEIPGSGGLGGPITVQSIEIGDVRFLDVKALTESATGSIYGSSGIRGILGLPFFESCLLTLDFPGRKVILESRELAAGEDTMPYSSQEEGDYGVTLRLSVGDASLKAHVDTGSPSFLTLLGRWEAELPLAGEPIVVGTAYTPSGSSEVRGAELDGVVTLGGHSFRNPSIDFADLGPMMDFDAGNIGSAFLESFALTIDQTNQRVRLRREASGDAPDDGAPVRVRDKRYRVGVAFAVVGEEWTIDFVAPGGPGEKGGLKAGDVLLTVNGNPSREVPEPELQKLCGSPESIVFQVQRDGEMLSVTVTPERA
jgi:predicted aspartyl protease